MSLWEKKDGIRESRFLIVTQQIVSPIHLSLAQIIKSVFTVTRCHFSPVTGVSFQTEGTGMISCDCGPLVCVKAADSFLVCMCFRQMEKWEKSTDTVTYYINGLNSPHVCNCWLIESKNTLVVCDYRSPENWQFLLHSNRFYLLVDCERV